MIVGKYGNAGDEIQWERDKENVRFSGVRLDHKKRACSKCKQKKELKGGTNKNFIFICKDCNNQKIL